MAILIVIWLAFFAALGIVGWWLAYSVGSVFMLPGIMILLVAIVGLDVVLSK